MFCYFKNSKKISNHIHLLGDKSFEKGFLETQHLMLISVDSWKKVIATKSVWLSNIPSTLVLSN